MINKISLKRFIQAETFLGFLVIIFFILALIISNTNLFDDYYNSFIFTPISFKVGTFGFDTIFINLVNDGIMTFFFLLIGLEMKYHLVLGEYVDRKTLILPCFAAVGGFIVPALIYLLINFNESTSKGWAITIASDTAFILAILAFFKDHISLKLRAFIIAFSLIDDALALLSLAIFYNETINIAAISISCALIAVLAIFNYYLKIKKTSYYIIVGIFLWIAMVESGVHGTLCGIIVALLIPVKLGNGRMNNHYHNLEKKLDYAVHYYILPLFIFINSGIVLKDFTIESILSNISIGIILGLFIGKQLGIFGLSYLSIKLGYCSLPSDTSFKKFYAISVLGGIGFTLSFFIGGLAFETEELDNSIRGAVILGSLLSAFWGLLMLKLSTSDREVIEKN